ncbi:MAG: cyclic nucleotide-binding domain-containing protein [Anaerolineaceae bacterium]|nr:cyclic nucleotide-binding domain-containing protein [Anaerolineaceae bacterium]
MPPDRIEIAAALRTTHLFRSLDDTQFGLVMDALEIGVIAPGEVLFSEGAPAWHFYILLKGKVKVTRIRQHKERQLATLRAGDYFGEEALRRRSHRPVTVTAVEETTLLRLEAHVLERLCQQIPPLKPNLRIVASTHQLMQSTRLDWLGSEESVYLMARKHIFFMLISLWGPATLIVLAMAVGVSLYATLLPGTFTPILLTALAYLAALVWGLWCIYDWSNDYNIVTSQRVVWQERVAGIYDSRQEAPLTTLLSVGVQTSQVGRMLGYGNVLVRTYTGTMMLRQVAYPNQVATLIEEHWTRSKEFSRQAEAEIIEETIRQRLGLDETKPTQDADKTFHVMPTEVQPGALQQWLATIFHVRFEQGGVVTYRKHWSMLVRMGWLPMAALVIATILFLTSVTGVLTLLPTLVEVLIAGAGITGAFLWLAYQYLDWQNDIYQITPDQIVDSMRKPLGKEERKTAPLENILSIEYQRTGLMGVILNFGTVIINVGSTKFDFEQVYNPSAVQQDVFQRMNLRIMSRKQAELVAERERMSDWITIYHQTLHQGSPVGLPGEQTGETPPADSNPK